MVGVRCPSERPHGHYDHCGRLMAITENGHIYLHCAMCKTFYELIIEHNDNIHLIPVDKNKRFTLEKRLTLVEK